MYNIVSILHAIHNVLIWCIVTALLFTFILLFLPSVDVVEIQMDLSSVSVPESGGMVNICAQIHALPAGGLGTDLVVALSTSNTDGKAGLQC